MLFHIVGKLGRWLKACDCHEDVWIWLQQWGARARKDKFAEHMLVESRNRCSQCWRVRRRASSLARGHLISMVKELKPCSSSLFNVRLAKLGREARNLALYRVTFTATKIQEELLEKFEYHQKIPHLICGVWPSELESQGIAQQCLQQFEAEPRMYSHRASIRMLSEDTYLVSVLDEGCRAGFGPWSWSLNSKQ